MAGQTAAEILQGWPEESREATQLVIDKYGEPQEVTDSLFVWHHPGPWKRIVATKAFYQHDFPVPHQDCIESVIDYRVPVDKYTAIAQFDGSVVTERTSGEVSARCHDEQANCLALNLTHDIVTGTKSVQEARDYYGKEFLDYRRKQPTPYMDSLQFTPDARQAPDPDTRTLTDDDLRRAADEARAVP